jgi:hypothetical protein
MNGSETAAHVVRSLAVLPAIGSSIPYVFREGVKKAGRYTEIKMLYPSSFHAAS